MGAVGAVAKEGYSWVASEAAVEEAVEVAAGEAAGEAAAWVNTLGRPIVWHPLRPPRLPSRPFRPPLLLFFPLFLTSPIPRITPRPMSMRGAQ